MSRSDGKRRFVSVNKKRKNERPGAGVFRVESENLNIWVEPASCMNFFTRCNAWFHQVIAITYRLNGYK